ncbi:FkbM family methyltransferase [Thermodesulfitimonas autotrophica]|uniref:FkbM family methyltransferase n=1 Tax=Thermodesulfitimonas autotrophica TaxID=1894989 RepID=A0A3N5BG28_9THEO|nr:FkbM family methyltransferase [Thermodesulfitimonas autotrophica]RPF47022.1 FkbM family methyltransferase [Thermodesulfitimonas autotrophica]
MISIITKLFERFRLAAGQKSFALDQLDLKLRPYLNFRNGFFIEAGANDGVSQSNTLYFERYMNWTGILIEPIPELADKCRMNRPRCIVESCALVSFDYEKRFVEMRYCNLMSLVKGALGSPETEQLHIEQGCKCQGISTYELKVPARTLTSILDQHSVGKIDFLSLDVEGYELNVLKGIDFDRYRPTFILIEVRSKDEIERFLRPLYKPVAILSHNDAYQDILYRLADA